MYLRKSLFFRGFLLSGIIVLSCSEKKLPVHITQYTDPSYITAIVKHNNAIYCATKGGLVRWDLTSEEYSVIVTADGLPSNNLSDVIVDTENRIWVGSDDGVGIFDGKSWKRYGTSEGLPSDEIKDLSLGGKGVVWAATAKGIASFNQGRFKVLTEEGGPGAIQVDCIFFDKGENVWVGTAEHGVFTKIKDKWRHTGSQNGLITDAANTIIQTWDNSIWAASWAGLSRWDGFGWKGFKPMKRLGTFKARQLLSSKNRLWFFTANGVHTSKGSDWKHYTEDDGLISNDVTCGYVVSDELIYVGTSYGLSVIENDTIKNYVIPNKHFGNNCISLAVDEKNRIWVGTWESGLNLNDSGYWSLIIGQDRNTFAAVRNIVFGPEENMVFNTSNGIVVKDTKGWKTYTRQEGVSSDDIRCGVYDAQGTYWAGTSTGICCFLNGRWKRYRAIHGLPSEDIRACAIDSSGTVWFGTSIGIISIADNTITDRTPEIGLDEIDVRSITVAGSTTYFGTESGKIITYEQGTWNIHGNRFLNTDRGIYSIAVEPSGALWFGTNGDGVIRLENKKAFKYTIADGLPSNYVRSVAYCDGVLWAACYGGVGTIELISH